MMETISSKYPDHTWELVSERSIRCIYRLLRNDSVEYYVKIYNPDTLLEKIRNFLSPRTLHEAYLLKQLQYSGIPVPEVKEHIHRKEASALITRAIFPAKGLHEVEKDAQIRIMLGMCVDLINHGYHFTDMHAGNIILDEKDTPFLVDAYEIIPCRRITPKNAASLLAQAANIYNLSGKDLDPYLSRIDAIADPGKLKRRIRSLSQSFRNARVKRWIRRSFREGSFSCIRDNGSYLAMVRRGLTLDLDSVMNAHRANISLRNNVYKFQDKTQLSRVGDYCVKSYKETARLATPYAKRSWKGALTLLFNDIPVADPVALVLFRDRKSMLITKALDQPDLDVLIDSEYDRISPDDRQRTAKAFGSLIGALHKRKIYHADLKASNIKADLSGPNFFFLDTDRVEQRRTLSRRKRLKNLVQINTSIPLRVSRGDRMVFLEAYCAVTGDDPRDMFRRVWKLSSGQEVVYRTLAGDRVERWDK